LLGGVFYNLLTIALQRIFSLLSYFIGPFTGKEQKWKKSKPLLWGVGRRD
jgi:hypothetical protein